MNKKTERVLLGVVVTVLVLYGIYQVAYGTNESAYRFGYKYGKQEWNCWQDPDAGCAMGQNVCTGTWDNAAKVVTNQTACIDGFINGLE